MTYTKYANFYQMLTDKKYRGYDIISTKLSNEEYESAITRGFIVIYCTYPSDFYKPELRNTPVVGVICDKKLNFTVAVHTDIIGEIDAKIESKVNKVLIIASNSPLNALAISKFEARPDITYYRYPLINFIIRPDQSVHMCKHSVESLEEVKLMESTQYLNVKNLPEIEADDAGIIWINAFPGDVIRIESISAIVMDSIVYRIVKKAKKRKVAK